MYGYVVAFIIETCKTAYLEEPDTSPICYLFTRIVLLLKMNMKLENLSYGGTDKRFHSVPFCVVLYIEKTVLPNNKIWPHSTNGSTLE